MHSTQLGARDKFANAPAQQPTFPILRSSTSADPLMIRWICIRKFIAYRSLAGSQELPNRVSDRMPWRLGSGASCAINPGTRDMSFDLEFAREGLGCREA